MAEIEARIISTKQRHEEEIKALDGRLKSISAFTESVTSDKKIQAI